jgi:hypothetical protein
MYANTIPPSSRTGVTNELLLDRAFWMHLERSLEASSVRTEEPAVIGAAQPIFIGDTMLQVDLAVKATVTDQAEPGAAVAEEHQILAQNADFPHRVVEQLRKRGDRNPVAAHQLATWGPRAHAGQALVHRFAYQPSLPENGLRSQFSVEHSRGAPVVNRLNFFWRMVTVPYDL